QRRADCVADHRRGVPRAGQAAGRPAGRCGEHRDPRRDRARRRLRDAGGRPARGLRDRLGADALLVRARLGAWLGRAGAGRGCALEGWRPLLLEIQSLVAPTDLAMPRRVGTGVDPKRLAMIVAVLSRHAGVALGQADVFVNVAGGVRIDEPGADLAIALAIVSAAKGAPVKPKLAAFGEIGLTGRLRPATQAERRLEECAKLGLAAAVAPAGTPVRGKLRVLEADTLRQAARAAIDAEPAEGG